MSLSDRNHLVSHPLKCFIFLTAHQKFPLKMHSFSFLSHPNIIDKLKVILKCYKSRDKDFLRHKQSDPHVNAHFINTG